MSLAGRQEEAAALIAADDLSDRDIIARLGIGSRMTLAAWKKKPEFAARVEELRAEFRARVRARGIAIMEHRVDRLQKTWDALKRVAVERAERYRDHDLTEARSGYYVPQLKLVKVYEAGELVPYENDEDLEGQPHGGALKRKRKDPLPDLSIRELLETGKLPESMQDLDFDVVDRKGGVLYSAKKYVEVTEWTFEAALVKALADIEKQAAQELGQWAEKKDITTHGTIEITGIEVDA